MIIGTLRTIAHRSYQGVVFTSRYRVNKEWTRERLTGRCSCGTTATTKGKKRISRALGRRSATSPGVHRARNDYPTATFRTSSAAACASGRSTTGTRALRRPLPVRVGSRRIRARAYCLRRQGEPLTATQNELLAAAGYPDAPVRRRCFSPATRGAQKFAGYGVFDMSHQLQHPGLESCGHG